MSLHKTLYKSRYTDLEISLYALGKYIPAQQERLKYHLISGHKGQSEERYNKVIQMVNYSISGDVLLNRIIVMLLVITVY